MSAIVEQQLEIEQEEEQQDVHPSPFPGDEDEAAGAEPMDVSAEELADPKNMEGIEKSLYFKELSMRAQHAVQLAEMFASHQEAVKAAAKKPVAEAAEGDEAAEAAAEAAEKKETGKLKLALKEQGRQEERLKQYKLKFAKNKVLARRKREARFAKVRAENQEEKALEKAIAKSVRAAAKKQQDLAHKAAMAAVRELEAGLSEEAIKEAAMKAYAKALKDAALEAEA